MLNLANLAEEVQIAYRRRIKLKNETVDLVLLMRLMQQLNLILKKLSRDLCISLRSPLKRFLMHSRIKQLTWSSLLIHLNQPADLCFKSMEGFVTVWLSYMPKILTMMISKNWMRLCIEKRKKRSWMGMLL